ncbi:hypothetical protein H8959_002877 [Pygathrix nigripes]
MSLRNCGGWLIQSLQGGLGGHRPRRKPHLLMASEIGACVSQSDMFDEKLHTGQEWGVVCAHSAPGPTTLHLACAFLNGQWLRLSFCPRPHEKHGFWQRDICRSLGVHSRLKS